jgi:large subunit ribosomal protein L23
MNLHQVIRRPLITEASTRLKDSAKTVCFEVDPAANKIEVKAAVEMLFKVKVESVRVANRAGKMKRMGRFAGNRRDWKKAYVRLAKGEKPIEFFEGV